MSSFPCFCSQLSFPLSLSLLSLSHPHSCFCPCRQPPSSCPVAEQHHHLATSVCVFSLPCSIAPHPSAGGCAFVLVPTTVTTPPCLQYGSSISMIEIRPKCIIMHPLKFFMTWSRERKRAREVAVADEFKLPHVEIKFLSCRSESSYFSQQISS